MDGVENQGLDALGEDRVGLLVLRCVGRCIQVNDLAELAASQRVIAGDQYNTISKPIKIVAEAAAEVT